MEKIYSQLRGGDLRSIGNADKIAKDAENNPTLVSQLVRGLKISEPVVRMRCADALEKLTRKHPLHLQAYRNELLTLLDPEQPKELLWHIVQMVPRIIWPVTKIEEVFKSLEDCLASNSSIVKVSVMQSLFELIDQKPSQASKVKKLLLKLSQTGSPAMKSRGTKLLHKMAG